MEVDQGEPCPYVYAKCEFKPSKPISHGIGVMTENGRSRPVSRDCTIICVVRKGTIMQVTAGRTR
jgi:hypothetical protein